MRAQGHAKAISILADAEAARISKLDAAMAGVSEVTARRELVLAAGEVMAKSATNLVIAPSAVDVAGMLGAGLGRGGGFGAGLLGNGGASGSAAGRS
jgi:regulator of protease activity HflC (stomatin/prohibitin superfamily)